MNNLDTSDSNHFEVWAFGKDILVYATGNGLLLIFGFLQSLIIPKFLSTSGYGYWQLFNLYIIYAGILHLGFLDGLLVHWSGKDLKQVSKDIKPAIIFLMLEQLAIITPLAVIIYFLVQPPFQWIGLMVCVYAFIWNLSTFFIFMTQAIRQFRLLTILNAGKGFVFLIFIFVLYISGLLQYQWVIITSLAAYLLFTLIIVLKYRRYLWGNKAAFESPVSYGKKYINTGIFILLGNFIVFLFWSLDRLLVSNFFTIEQFAFYAFAMSVVNIILTFIRAVADVFFPHLSAAGPTEQVKVYQVSKKLLIISWALLMSAYFPLAALIEFYLPNYAGSLSIVKIMFGALGFNSLILIIHVNYYRMYRRLRQYFGFGIVALALAVVLLIISIKVLGTLESVAATILISSLAWCIINELSLKDMTGETGGRIWKDFAAMGCYIAGLVIATVLNYWLIVQMLVYIAFFIMISLSFFRSEVISFLSNIRRGWVKFTKRV